MTELLSKLRKQAREKSPKILLPEGEDARVLEAAARVGESGIARAVVLGTSDAVRRVAHVNDIVLDDVRILDPTEAQIDEYAAIYADLRDVPHEVAVEMLDDELVLGGLLTRIGEVDGFVAGAVNSSADVVAVANGVVGFHPTVDTGSSFFIMDFDREDVGENGVLLFADCGVNIAPSDEQLADIAVSTANTAENLFGWTPRVALLSYSTKGSASHETVEKIQRTAELARQQRDSIVIDGELQVDAALVPDVAEKKTDDSALIRGDANVLIFPDLQAGNIAYKIADRLAGAKALGPVLQGYARPISDLSRGASADDIVDVITVTAAMAVADPGTNAGDIVTSGALNSRESSSSPQPVNTE